MIRGERARRRRTAGQATLEFVIMLALGTLLALSLLLLFGAVSDDGEKMSARVCYNVP